MKTRLYILLAATVLFGFSSCTSKSERAKMVSEAFWRVIDTGQTDSINILYPNFANLGVRTSSIKLMKYETKDVIDRGDKSFEVRTIVYPRGAKDPEICSLFIRKENGNWTIYDSRYLTVHRFEDLKLLKAFNGIGDGDIYMEMTDQERCFAIDSVIGILKENAIQAVKAEVAEKVNISTYSRKEVFAMHILNAPVKITNNTHYDLSYRRISYSFKYVTEVSKETFPGEYEDRERFDDFKPGKSGSIIVNGFVVKSVSNFRVSISDDEAWKAYKPTGTEYKEYMQSIGK